MNVDEKRVGGNLIQIGLDPSSAFVRKSPTPLQKPLNANLHSSVTSLQKNRPLTDSQLSLLSDRSANNNNSNHKYTMGLGIPHNDHNHNYRLNYPVAGQNHLPSHHLQHHSNNGVTAFKMPMNLEDLDDLLKYADEHGGEARQDLENGNEVIVAEKIPKPKELLTAKGSNNSIGQLSNMCSSGYQSISTQSQSSSPVEATGPLDYLNHKRSHTNPRNGPLKYQFGGTKATVNAVFNQNHLVKGSGGRSSQKSSSLTPSSSEERLSEDHHYGLMSPSAGNNNNNNNNSSGGSHSGVLIGEIRGESELNMITSVLNGGRSAAAAATTTTGGSGGGGTGRRPGYNRTPRTNPLYYNSGTTERESRHKATEQDDLNASLPYSSVGVPKGLNGSRFQRRLSLESARTLSDSSTDTEGEEGGD